jgi:hypothetical protein
VAAAAADAAAMAEAVINEPCGKVATAIHVAVAAGSRIEANSRTRAEWIARSLLLRHHRYTVNGLTSTIPVPTTALGQFYPLPNKVYRKKD